MGNQKIVPAPARTSSKPANLKPASGIKFNVQTMRGAILSYVMMAVLTRNLALAQDNSSLNKNADNLDAMEKCFGPDLRPFNGDTDNPLNLYHTHSKDNAEGLIGRGYSLKHKGFYFDSTPLNYNVAHHHYGRLSIYKEANPKEFREACNMEDSNGRTPFLLSAALASPGTVQRELLTAYSAVQPDNEGVTPLMLASAGFMNAETLRELLKKIGPAEIESQLAKKDKSNRGIPEYRRMTTDEIIARLKALEVDGSKASNNCFNAFGFDDKNGAIIVYDNEMIDRFQNLGFDMGEITYRGGGYIAVKATKANMPLIVKLASDVSGEFYHLRKEMNKYYPDTDKAELRKKWQNHKDAALRLQKQLSPNSLSYAIQKNQQGNARIVKEYLESAKQQKGNSDGNVRYIGRTELSYSGGARSK